MTSAFEMAGYGRTAVDNILNDKDQSENIDNIVKWMFYMDDEDTRGSAKMPRLRSVKGRVVLFYKVLATSSSLGY